ncbi:MAG: metallophosphoesterase family protein [Labilithrix sp.]|nr:metallophosphoesterase family protein [Labilithrix sp.]MCW5817434.1 metallophosphoesterase family protein [Labilithrix sp.]
MTTSSTAHAFATPPAQARRLGIISCIHGNLEALESVLADLRARDVDSLLCLGDLVGYGPFPDESTSRIRELGVPTVLGCWDEGIAEENENCGCTFVTQEEGQLGAMAFLWTTLHVSEETKSYLGTLPMSLAFDLPCGRLVAVHGSPASTSEYLMESTHELVLFERAASAGGDLLVCGHTHVPYVKHLAGALAEDRHQRR